MTAGWLRALLGILDLKRDQASPEAIDATIRAGVEFRGTNLWLLVFATFIASIGLNVNSAAVIIGAMLVSPLMGPIMGVGYGAAINDFTLMRTALKNLAVAIVFSLLASTLYFALSPLSDARSEILARTSPAIWDVLIATFGGLAGIIGLSRREKSNVVPGVAIATALMPPLCTAGFGIASFEPAYTLGALYLFTINSVFIATATMVMARAMHLPEIAAVDPVVQSRARRAIAAGVLLTSVPSIVLAFFLVQEELFGARAEQFVATSFPRELGTYVVARDIDRQNRSVRVTVVGEPITPDRRVMLEQALHNFGLDGTVLAIDEAHSTEVDIDSLRAQVAGDLYKDTVVALDAKEHEIAALRDELEAVAATNRRLVEIERELRATRPDALAVGVGVGAATSGGATSPTAVIVTLSLSEPMSEEERARLDAWLKVRADTDAVQLTVLAPAPVPDRAKPTARRRP